jgi:hypothetical protein
LAAQAQAGRFLPLIIALWPLTTLRLIALLLGRLRFPVSVALELYGKLSEDVFDNRAGYLADGTFDPVHLERAVQDCVEKSLGKGQHDATMLDPNDGRGACKRYYFLG